MQVGNSVSTVLSMTAVPSSLRFQLWVSIRRHLACIRSYDQIIFKLVNSNPCHSVAVKPSSESSLSTIWIGWIRPFTSSSWWLIGCHYLCSGQSLTSYRLRRMILGWICFLAIEHRKYLNSVGFLVNLKFDFSFSKLCPNLGRRACNSLCRSAELWSNPWQS